MATATALESAAPAPKALHIGLWVAQALLAFAFIAAGAMKTFTPIEQLGQGQAWMSEMPWLVRFIGISELLGGIGVVLPGITKILPRLVGYAALGLTVVMILAVGFHVMQNDAAHPGPAIVLGLLAAFVTWGRLSRAPIASRTGR